ncbi:MAG: amidase family protein, partial [Hyphomicrobiales bacterium]
HKPLLEVRGDDYDQRVARRIKSGGLQSADELIEVIAFREEMIDVYEQQLSGFDAFIMPTSPWAPPPIADLADDDEYVRINLNCLRNTFIGNFLDTCAIAQPMGDQDGAPVGLMLMAAGGSDHSLFSVAEAVEGVIGFRA